MFRRRATRTRQRTPGACFRPFSPSCAELDRSRLPSRRERVLPESGIGEDAAESVVILLRNRIVLVIVAAGASDSQTEEAFGQRVDFVISLVRPRLDIDDVITGKPGSDAKRIPAPEAFSSDPSPALDRRRFAPSRTGCTACLH